VPSQPQQLVPNASPLNRTLIIGGMFAVAADCLSTIAQFLDDIGNAHAIHFQQQQERRMFAASAAADIQELTEG